MDNQSKSARPSTVTVLRVTDATYKRTHYISKEDMDHAISLGRTQIMLRQRNGRKLSDLPTPPDVLSLHVSYLKDAQIEVVARLNPPL